MFLDAVKITTYTCACGGGSASTISTPTVTPTSFTLGCTGTATANVAFTSVGTYTSNNTYTAFLSDASGNFALSTQVGQLQSSANTGTITITIPAGTPSGTGYQVQISSYIPQATSGVSNAFTITNTCTTTSTVTPVVGVMTNCYSLRTSNSNYGCDAQCDESVFSSSIFTSSNATTQQAMEVDCRPDTISNDVSSDLNQVTCSGGCGTFTSTVTFTVTAACTYTAEAFFGARGANCPDAAMDGGDALSIIATPLTGGASIVSQSATLTSPGACSGINVGVNSYPTSVISTGCGNSQGYAKMVYTAPTSAVGAITISYTSNRCDEILTFTFTAGNTSCGIIVLPINLIALAANRTEKGNILINWTTATEINNSYFEVQYSLDAINFIPFAHVEGAGTSYDNRKYNILFTEDIGNRTPYFRLKQVDFNGKSQYSTIVTLGSYVITPYVLQPLTAYYDNQGDDIVVDFHLDYPQQVSISLYNVSGQEESLNNTFFNEGDNQFLLDAPDKAGIYFLVYQNGASVPVHKKIMITK